jgi:hypothetical protein
VPFSLDEVKNTIKSMPPDKAPGPDSFPGAFFKACWKIIKEDVMAAINRLFTLNAQGFEWLNSGLHRPSTQKSGSNKSHGF